LAACDINIAAPMAKAKPSDLADIK